MPTERRRWCEPILEPILADTGIWLACRFVDNVDAMPAPMATWNALRLSIKAYANIAQSKLTHEVLTIRATERHRNRTLYTSVGSGTIRRKPSGLEGKNLIRSELLLIQGSLLTLECFDLVLNCNLLTHGTSVPSIFI
jgi:hypothetical protein